MGEHSYLSTTAGVLAQTLYEQGRYDEADEVAAVGAASASTDDIGSHVFLRGTAAKIAARRGDAPRAEALASDAVALARRTDFVNMVAGALSDLGEVLALGARAAEAGTAFAQAIALYEAKENLSAARAAGRKRKELAAAA
jgi:hypothetical protein